jgi:hypothetical protein
MAGQVPGRKRGQERSGAACREQRRGAPSRGLLERVTRLGFAHNIERRFVIEVLFFSP